MLINNNYYSQLNVHIPKVDKQSNKKATQADAIEEPKTEENASNENTNKKAKKKQPQYTPEQIKEQIERMNTQNKTRNIYFKARNGSQLSPEEAKHLSENSAGLYDTVKEAEKERAAFRKEIENLNSKNAIDKFKTSKTLDYLHKIEKADRVGNNSDVEKYTMFINTIENEYRAYTKTEEFKKLPKEDEDDLSTNLIKKTEK